ncbi:MAG: guanine deaminase, partial [Humibacillus sp.]|nr:guanine deaminase [Humibacillus sp.]
MTLYRGTVLDTPDGTAPGGIRLRSELDGGILVESGIITERSAFSRMAARHPEHEIVDLRGGLVLPGLIDAHVHYPQVRVIGALGMPLLEWLEQCALPEEARLADPGYAADVAVDFVQGLVSAGTTTSLVFGSHFAPAMDALF